MELFIISTALFLASTVYLLKLKFDSDKKYKPYQAIAGIDAETSKFQLKLTELKNEESLLRTQKRVLENDLSLLSDKRDLAEIGLYQYKYDFKDSSEYDLKIESIREKQKQLVKDKRAIICGTDWTVGGSKVEGRKMIDRITRLGLLAFNNQCENEIMKVRFDNVARAKEKLEKVRVAIDKLLEPNTCRITQEFLNLKIQELHLVHEYQETVQREKEEQKIIRQQMKEEQEALAEAEK